MNENQNEHIWGLPLDTNLEAMQIYYQRLAEMTPSQRFECAADMFDAVEAFAKAGIRMAHPEYDEKRIHIEVIRRRLGSELFGQAYPEHEA